MRIAIIDCGTNTFNLLIAEYTTGEVKFIAEEKIPVKIGKGGIENRIITPEAYQRALDAMQKYAQTIQQYTPDQVIATSTSAFRSTDNGPQLKQEIFSTTGIEVKIISGDEEAELIYKGVTWALPPEKGINYLVMDIGGGSTEFILYNHEKIFFKKSYLLGASRLLEKFTPQDPLSKNDIDKYYAHFESELNADLLNACKINPPQILVGSSGYFDTLRSVCYYQANTVDDSILTKTNSMITVNEFNLFHELILPMNQHARTQIKGMTAFRAEMMGVSTLLVNFIIQQTGVNSIINTTYALKEGVLRGVLGE